MNRQLIEIFTKDSDGKIVRARFNTKTGEIALSVLDFQKVGDPLMHVIFESANVEGMYLFFKTVYQRRYKRHR